MASRPSELLAGSHTQAAERAFQALRLRAQRLPADDSRRATLLAGMADYLLNKGEPRESIATYRAWLEILSEHALSAPVDYMLGLHTFAGILMRLKDFAGAQEAFEKTLDWIPVAKKQFGEWVDPRYYDQWEFTARIDLAYLFALIGSRAEAMRQVEHAERLLVSVEPKRQGECRDMVFACSALAKYSAGDLDEAWHDCERMEGLRHNVCLYARAKLRLARGEFAMAEQLLKLMGAPQRASGLDMALDLAEAIFGQSKNDDAFASFEEARRMVAHFALPADDAWRKALATWLQRAKDLGRTELAASLQKELAQVSATPLQAITILDRFRIQPPETR